MHEINTLNWVVGTAAGIIAGLAVLVPTGVKFWRTKISPNLVSKRTILKQVQESAEEIRKMSLELRPNGGSTLRDAIDRVERLQLVQTEKQRAVFTTLPFGVFETDVEGNVIWSNRKLSRMTGRTPSELRGSGWLNALQYEDRSRVRANWARSLASQSEYEENATLQTMDGALVPVFIHSMKLEGREGEALQYVVTVTEITDASEGEDS